MSDVKCWDDLPESEKKEAIRDNTFFASLQSTYPEANFSERDELLKKYEITLVCRYCDAQISANFLLGIPDICPQCKRASLNTPTAPGAVADWLLAHYRVATTRNKDQNLYIYDEATGTWSDEKADAIIKHECSVIFGDNITSQRVNNVRLALQGKTFVEPSIFHTALQEKDGSILINAQNGVVKFNVETFKVDLQPKDPSWYFLSQIPVTFNPEAPIPDKFINFLAEVTLPNEENFVNLLEGFGYSLLPGYPIQRVLALVGSGQNGKSTFFAAMEQFYGAKFISHLTMQQLSNSAENSPFALVQLQGRLANIADDLPNKPVRDVGYFKMLTGGSSVEAERKFGNRFSFVNTAKFYFSANRMPEVSEDTVAFYRRFLFIEFTNTINKPRDQKEVLAEIVSEEQKSGLFNLLLTFVLPRLLRQNDFTCARSVDAVAEQYQKHSNTAKLFLDKMLEYDPNGVIRKEDLWDTYEQFCSEKGLVLVSQKGFWSSFKEEFTQAVEQQYQENGVHKRNIKGVNFKKPDEEEDPVEHSKKVTLEDYLNQDNQDNQDSGIFYAVYKVSEYIKEIKKKAGYVGHAGGNQQQNSNTLLDTSNQTLPNSAFQENENNASASPAGEAMVSVTFPSPSLPPSAALPSKGPEAWVSPSPAVPGPEPQLSDFALSQKIHAVIDKVVHKIPAAGAIVGEKLNDFSYLLNADDFRDLPKDKVELELKNMVQLGDLKIVPNTGGFAVTPARKQDAETNDYDEY